MSGGFETAGRSLFAVIGILIAVPTDDAPVSPAASGEPARAFAVILADGDLETRGRLESPLQDDLVSLVSSLRSGRATATPEAIEVTGVASAHGGWLAALDDFEERLPAERSLVTDVVVIDDALALDDLCARMFAKLADARIEFRQASSVLRPASHAALDRIVDFARSCRQGILEIAGHTDGVGSAQLNLDLSRRRAAAVAAYLVAAGVPGARLRTVARGATEPVADNATIGGRARNRRIEFRLLRGAGR